MWKKLPWLDGLLAIVCLISLATTVLFGLQLYRRARPVTASGVVVGNQMLPISARSTSGESVLLRFDEHSKPTILYVVSPTCIWCKRNAAAFGSLVKDNGDRFRFVVVSLGQLSDSDFTGLGLSEAEVIIDPAPEDRIKYGLGRTPQTIAVAPDGRVLANFFGAYSGRNATRVASFFGSTIAKVQ
jgi:hypothetical protein